MSRIEDGGAVEAGLVERLEAWAAVIEANDDCPAAGHTMHEAAAEITGLRAENAGMREALAELIWTANAIVGADPSDYRAEDAFNMFSDARSRARAALSKASQAEGQTP